VNARDLALAVGARKSGHRYLARCIAHKDKSPSLSITDGADGRVLVHCFAGCSQDAVIAALRQRGLWPERERPSWTIEQRRAWARRRSAAEDLAQRVSDWAHGKATMLEAEKRQASEANYEPALESAARALYLHETLTGAELIAAYRADVAAAAYEQAGREDREHAEQTTAVIVAVIATAERRRGAE